MISLGKMSHSRSPDLEDSRRDVYWLQGLEASTFTSDTGSVCDHGDVTLPALCLSFPVWN